MTYPQRSGLAYNRYLDVNVYGNGPPPPKPLPLPTAGKEAPGLRAYIAPGAYPAIGAYPTPGIPYPSVYPGGYPAPLPYPEAPIYPYTAPDPYYIEQNK